MRYSYEMLLVTLSVLGSVFPWAFLVATAFGIRNSDSGPGRQTVCVVWGGAWVWLCGTGGASVPNSLHHPASDLLIQGSLLFHCCRAPGLICIQHRYGGAGGKKPTSIVPHPIRSCFLVLCCTRAPACPRVFLLAFTFTLQLGGSMWVHFLGQFESLCLLSSSHLVTSVPTAKEIS